MKISDHPDDKGNESCKIEHDHNTENEPDHGRRNFLMACSACGCAALTISAFGTALLADAGRAEAAAGGQNSKSDTFRRAVSPICFWPKSETCLPRRVSTWN